MKQNVVSSSGDASRMAVYVQKNNFEEAMTESENERVKTLCARIKEEKDAKAFAELVIELNLLLDRVLGLPPGLD